MIKDLYKWMMIPDTCRLGKRVYKKLFQENAKLGPTDKKALRDDVDLIIWQYTFKASTIPIQPYEDEMREYHEVALLQVDLKKTGRAKRLAEIIHRAIPYPLIVVFAADRICSISLAHKRFSKAEKDAIVVERFQSTGWLDFAIRTENQTAFLESMNIATWPQTHFYAFYRAAMERVIAIACATHSGQYSLKIPQGRSLEDRAQKLRQVDKLHQKQKEIQAKLKKEKNLGTQVNLNTQFQEIRVRLTALKNEL